MWTMALVKDGFHDLPSDHFHTYAILKDGKIVGELKWDRGRWKSAGGPAWQGKLFAHRHGMDVIVYSKNKAKVLAWFKNPESLDGLQ